MNNLLPDNWKITTLNSNASLITDGSHFSPITDENGRPIATVKNMRCRHIDISSCRLISDEKFLELERGNCMPLIGDVLFSKDGTIGKTFVYKQNSKIVILSSIAIIRLEQQKLFPDYCTQYLQSSLFYKQLENATSGSAIRRVVLKDIKQLKIPTPPLPEQQKIAAILTSVDEVIEKTQAQIDKLKDLKTAMMQELLSPQEGRSKDVNGNPFTAFKDSPLGRIPVDWEVKLIGGLCSHIVDCVNKTAPVVDYKTNYKMIRTTNVRHGRIDTDNVRNVTKETFDIWTRRMKPQNGDLIFTREAPVGECGVLKDARGVFLGQRTMMYRADETKTTSVFLMYSLMTRYCQKQLEDFSGGSTVPHMRVPDCQKILIKIPKLHDQRKISESIASIDNAIDSKKLRMNKLIDTKKALMQDLLTGKVRVNVDDIKQEPINV
jgi:type I restriction enzyme S subunit